MPEFEEDGLPPAESALAETKKGDPAGCGQGKDKGKGHGRAGGGGRGDGRGDLGGGGRGDAEDGRSGSMHTPRPPTCAKPSGAGRRPTLARQWEAVLDGQHVSG